MFIPEKEKNPVFDFLLSNTFDLHWVENLSNRTMFLHQHADRNKMFWNNFEPSLFSIQLSNSKLFVSFFLLLGLLCKQHQVGGEQ